MFDVENYISSLIESQFPEFYREEGEDFVAFIKAYYEYLEETGNAVDVARNLPDLRDIDTTLPEFLKYFKNKYMNSLPSNVIGNKRDFQKHILDVYRSKGSESGLRLLFRILYDEDISTYIPSYDILKPSDGLWIQNKYLEVSDSSINKDFQDKRIRGLNSNSTAVVDSFQRRNVNNRSINIMFLSNIEGDFQVNEVIYFDGADPLLCPIILGSPIGLSVVESISGQDIGDIVNEQTEFGSGKKDLSATVTEIFDGDGIIEFKLENGGSGYSNNLIISVLPGSNTTGSGASFEVIEFSNTSIYVYSDIIIEPYLNVELDAVSYSSGAGDTSTMSSADIDSIIGTAIDAQYITIGTISKIRTTNPGTGYDGDVIVEVTDPIVSQANLSDGSGGIIGNNAVVTGKAILGNVITDLRVLNSGFGYYDEEEILTFSNISQTPTLQSALKVRPILGPVGSDFGSWFTTQGFLNSDKYIQDSFYYQEYSYEIRSSRSLDKYIDILRKLVHPSGNEVFSKATAFSFVDKTPQLVEFDILTFSTTDSLTYSINMDLDGAVTVQNYIDETYFLSDFIGESRQF
jgi:hypothetical protein